MTDGSCKTQETYETKGQASKRLCVKDYFSHKFSNNKASIVSQQTLKLAAGANERLTGPDSSASLPEPLLSSPKIRNYLKCEQKMKNKPNLYIWEV